MTLANGLVEKGWTVNLVVLNLNDSVYQDRLSPNVNLTNLHKGHIRTSFFALHKYLRTARPEKVVVFNHELAVLLVMIRMLTSLQFSIIARNINTLSLKRENEESFWCKYGIGFLVDVFYGRVDYVIAQSEDMKKDLIENMGFNNHDRISVINNPVNHIIEAFIKDFDFSSVRKQDYLLCIGKLEKQKAFHLAIEAFSEIVYDYPELRLKILGKGSQEHRLKVLAEKLGIYDKVDFEGFQKDVIPYYLNARATVLTSLYEGFPNVLVESIALGTPVVAFDCYSGPREIIRDGVNGFLAEHEDLEGLVECLKRTIDMRWNLKQVSETANIYKSEVIVNRYERLLSSLILPN